MAGCKPAAERAVPALNNLGAFVERVWLPVVAVDPGGIIQFANAAARDVLSGPAAELGGTAIEALREPVAGALLPDDQRLPVLLRAADGRSRLRMRWDRANASPSKEWTYGIGSLEEASTRAPDDLVRGAAEEIPIPLALWHCSGRPLWFNSAFRAVFGNPPQTPNGMAPWSWVLSRSAEIGRLVSQSNDPAQASSETAPPRGDFELQLEDGRWFRVSQLATSEGGWWTMAWENTLEVRQERDASAARVVAEAASAAKSEFLASMSHELRTPLNSILGFAQLLQQSRRDRLSERQREMVTQIHRGGEYLLRLINEILDLAKIESGNISLTIEPVSAMSVAEEAVRALRPLAEEARIRLEWHLVEGDVPLVLADAQRLRQILINLGSNAIKYNSAGGHVVLSVAHAPPDHVRVKVRDDGFGIPAAQQARLFQPFHRAGQEAGNIEGTGIGLAITHRLAELMSAQVGFSSREGVGSEFWLDLPVHRARKPTHAPTALPPELDTEVLGRLGRVTVLYVEDNASNASLVQTLLEEFDNFELRVANTAQEGLAVARAQPPSVILMDLNLPGMGGVEAVRALKADPTTAAVPVVALTAAARGEDRARALAAGFAAYLTKPLRTAHLVQVLAKVLRG